MRKRPRITRFDGAVLADALFLIGQAWVRGEDGDADGAAADLAAAMKLIPPDTVEAIHHFIEAGTLPEPSSAPGGMDAWLETCRQAGAGELKVTRILFPSAAEVAERPPWEVDSLTGLARPGSLSDELRKMGLM